MAEINVSTATCEKHSLNQKESVAQRPVPEVKLGLSDAFGIGANSVNRIGTMVCAALQIANDPRASSHTVVFLAEFLQEVRNLTEDLAGMLEGGRDAAAARSVN